MTARYHPPTYRIWVRGRPQSAQKRGSRDRYVEAIRVAARSVVERPTASRRLDVDVWFCADSVSRADVDNVLKPVLDALCGVVYLDDRQVRSVRAVAVPNDDAMRFSGPLSVINRLFAGREFLVNVYEGLLLAGRGP